MSAIAELKLAERLEALQAEAQKCQASMGELNQSLAAVQQQALRIDGAIHLVRELMQEHASS